MNVKQSYERAIALQKSGRVKEALASFQAIALSNPGFVPAHFQIGQMLLATSRVATAVRHLATARKLEPKQPAVWQASMAALGNLGDAKQLSAFRKELDKAPIDPNLKRAMLAKLAGNAPSDFGAAPKAEVDATIAALMSRNAEKALPLAQNLNARFPNVGLITNLLASACELSGDTEGAEFLYRKATLQDPLDKSIRVNFGRFLMETGDERGATKQYRLAYAAAPNDRDILGLLADALRTNGNVSEALSMLDAGLKKDPAAALLRFSKSKSLAELDRNEEAAEILADLIAATPDKIDLIMEEASQASRTGQFDKATASLERALELDPSRMAVYKQIATIKKFKADDPMIDKLLELESSKELVASAKSQLNFTLGKIHEDIKSFDRAFDFYTAANQLEAQERPWDKDKDTRYHDVIRYVADTVDLPALARANSGESRSPIFVTGLPRSGTTLTEQILAAHSSTTGVGEASWWPRTTFEFYRTLSLKKLDKATIERSIRSMADAYFDKAMSDFPTAGRIVDKSLMKHEQIGIVLAAIPKSKMIVLKRDPRDNLLSIFKNQFRAGQIPYNNDLDGLAWTYRKYLDAIAFWQEQFPDQFYVLDYDKLTSDPESEARKLLKFADLDWEDSVLDFHKSTSTVKTLSVYQVRQPIYTSSQKGWQKFGSKIEPLIEALRRHNVPLDEG